MYLLGTGVQRAGKLSRVLIGVTQPIALAFSSWTLRTEVVNLPTTNFQSYNAAANQTYTEQILGPIGMGIDYGGDWDAGTNPIGTPPGLYPRDDLQGVSLYTSVLDNIFWFFPWEAIRTVNAGSDTVGKVTFTTSGLSQGPFTQPTGSVAATR